MTTLRHLPSLACLGRIHISILRHRRALLAAALSVPVLLFFISYGTFRLFDAESFGDFYDAQARSWVNGRWDVPRASIAAEAMIRDGKCYGYFGPTPAVFRLPLNLLFPKLSGRWTKLSILFAVLVTALAAAWVCRQLLCALQGNRVISRVKTTWDGWWVLTIALGSTSVFLASRAYAYHEALAWACALTLLFYASFFQYLRDFRGRHLACLAIWTLLSPLARVAGGAAPVITLGLYVLLVSIYRVRQRTRGILVAKLCDGVINTFGIAGFIAPGAHMRYLVLAVCAPVTLYCLVNYAKFRTVLDGNPIRLHYQYASDSKRLNRIGGTLVHPENIRHNLVSYFLVRDVGFVREFPWFRPINVKRPSYPEARIDFIEVSTGIGSTMPAILLVSAVGLGCFIFARSPGLRIARLAVLGAAAGSLPALMNAALSHRYKHDFLPLLVILGGAGVGAITRLRQPYRASGMAVLAFLSAYGVVANCGLALYYQNESVWGTPEASVRGYGVLKRAVDNVLYQRPLAIEVVNPSNRLAPCVMGQLVQSKGGGYRFWCDGASWQLVHARNDEAPIVLKVRHPSTRAGMPEPLMISGVTHSADILFVRPVGGTRYRIGIDVWGYPAIEGKEFEIPNGVEVTIAIRRDFAEQVVLASVQGESVLEYFGMLHSCPSSPLWFGENKIHASTASVFGGEISMAK